jgi:hypothetical protein
MEPNKTAQREALSEMCECWSPALTTQLNTKRILR